MISKNKLAKIVNTAIKMVTVYRARLNVVILTLEKLSITTNVTQKKCFNVSLEVAFMVWSAICISIGDMRNKRI